MQPVVDSVHCLVSLLQLGQSSAALSLGKQILEDFEHQELNVDDKIIISYLGGFQKYHKLFGELLYIFHAIPEDLSICNWMQLDLASKIKLVFKHISKPIQDCYESLIEMQFLDSTILNLIKIVQGPLRDLIAISLDEQLALNNWNFCVKFLLQNKDSLPSSMLSNADEFLIVNELFEVFRSYRFGPQVILSIVESSRPTIPCNDRCIQSIEVTALLVVKSISFFASQSFFVDLDNELLSTYWQMIRNTPKSFKNSDLCRQLDEIEAILSIYEILSSYHLKLPPIDWFERLGTVSNRSKVSRHKYINTSVRPFIFLISDDLHKWTLEETLILRIIYENGIAVDGSNWTVAINDATEIFHKLKPLDTHFSNHLSLCLLKLIDHFDDFALVNEKLIRTITSLDKIEIEQFIICKSITIFKSVSSCYDENLEMSLKLLTFCSTLSDAVKQELSWHELLRIIRACGIDYVPAQLRALKPLDLAQTLLKDDELIYRNIDTFMPSPKPLASTSYFNVSDYLDSLDAKRSLKKKLESILSQSYPGQSFIEMILSLQEFDNLLLRKLMKLLLKRLLATSDAIGAFQVAFSLLKTYIAIDSQELMLEDLDILDECLRLILKLLSSRINDESQSVEVKELAKALQHILVKLVVEDIPDTLLYKSISSFATLIYENSSFFSDDEARIKGIDELFEIIFIESVCNVEISAAGVYTKKTHLYHLNSAIHSRLHEIHLLMQEIGDMEMKRNVVVRIGAKITELLAIEEASSSKLSMPTSPEMMTQPDQIHESLINSLTKKGFSRNASRRAILAMTETSKSSWDLNDALNWLIERSGDVTLDHPIVIKVSNALLPNHDLAIVNRKILEEVAIFIEEKATSLGISVINMNVFKTQSKSQLDDLSNESKDSSSTGELLSLLRTAESILSSNSGARISKDVEDIFFSPVDLSESLSSNSPDSKALCQLFKQLLHCGNVQWISLVESILGAIESNTQEQLKSVLSLQDDFKIQEFPVEIEMATRDWIVLLLAYTYAMLYFEDLDKCSRVVEILNFHPKLYMKILQNEYHKTSPFDVKNLIALKSKAVDVSIGLGYDDCTKQLQEDIKLLNRLSRIMTYDLQGGEQEADINFKHFMISGDNLLFSETNHPQKNDLVVLELLKHIHPKNIAQFHRSIGKLWNLEKDIYLFLAIALLQRFASIEFQDASELEAITSFVAKELKLSSVSLLHTEMLFAHVADVASSDDIDVAKQLPLPYEALTSIVVPTSHAIALLHSVNESLKVSSQSNSSSTTASPRKRFQSSLRASRLNGEESNDAATNMSSGMNNIFQSQMNIIQHLLNFLESIRSLPNHIQEEAKTAFKSFKKSDDKAKVNIKEPKTGNDARFTLQILKTVLLDENFDFQNKRLSDFTNAIETRDIISLLENIISESLATRTPVLMAKLIHRLRWIVDCATWSKHSVDVEMFLLSLESLDELDLLILGNIISDEFQLSPTCLQLRLRYLARCIDVKEVMEVEVKCSLDYVSTIIQIISNTPEAKRCQLQHLASMLEIIASKEDPQSEQIAACWINLIHLAEKKQCHNELIDFSFHLKNNTTLLSMGRGNAPVSELEVQNALCISIDINEGELVESLNSLLISNQGISDKTCGLLMRRLLSPESPTLCRPIVKAKDVWSRLLNWVLLRIKQNKDILNQKSIITSHAMSSASFASPLWRENVSNCFDITLSELESSLRYVSPVQQFLNKSSDEFLEALEHLAIHLVGQGLVIEGSHLYWILHGRPLELFSAKAGVTFILSSVGSRPSSKFLSIIYELYLYQN